MASHARESEAVLISEQQRAQWIINLYLSKTDVIKVDVKKSANNFTIKRKDGTIVAKIPLEEISEIQCQPDSKLFQNCFWIRWGPKKIYYLQADSEAQRTEILWVILRNTEFVDVHLDELKIGFGDSKPSVEGNEPWRE